MVKEVNEHYLKEELQNLIKTDSTMLDFIQDGFLDGMWYWNLENIEDEWLSPRFWEVLGYDPKDRKHKSSEWQDIIFKEDLKHVEDNFDKHLQDPNYPFDQIVRYKHKDGSTVWIRCRGIAIRDKNSKATRMLGVHNNITELKQNEKSLIESEQRFRVTVESLDDGVVIHAPDSSVIDYNSRALEILGLCKDQLLGKKAFDPIWKFTDEDENPLRLEKYPINLILTNQEPINNLTIGIVSSIDKKIVWCQVKGTPIFDSQGNLKEVVVSFFDISQLKISNKRLTESEQRFKILHHASFGGVAVHDKGLIVECNQGLSDITGFSMEELVGMNGLLLMAPEYRDFVMEKIMSGYEKAYEAFGIRKNGEIYPIKLEARNLPYHGKQVRVVEFRDITELKQKEKSLIESENRFRILFERAPFGYQSLDNSGRFIEVNEKWLEIMGYQKEEVVGKWFGDFLVPEMRESFSERFELFKKRGTVHSEFSMKTKNGDIILVGFDGNVSFNENQSFIQTHCTVTDITEVTIANKKLIESEEQYRLLTSEMHLGMALHETICDDKGKPIDYKFISVNNSFERLTGLKGEDILGKTVLEVLPNIEKYWIEVYGDVALTGEPIQYENYSKEIGKYFKTSAYSPKKGQFAVLVEDITERALIEKQLAKEKADLLTSQKIAKLGTWRLDVKTNEVIWSEELYKMYGFDPNQPVPPYTEHMNLFSKDSWKQLSTALELTRTKGIPYELELEMSLKDDSKGWMWVRGEAEYDDQGQIVSLTGAAQDITNEKIVQEELYKSYQIISEQKRMQETLISNLPGITYRCKNDDAFTMVYISDQVENITGYSSREFYDNQITYAQIVHPDDEDAVHKVFLNSHKTRNMISMVYRLINKSGDILWVRENAKKIISQSGEDTGFIEGFIEEITKEKRAEEEVVYAANHDYLTNLYNRRYFANAFDEFATKGFTSIGLMMIDINGLKIINDAYGHVRGDVAIRKVANLLLKVFDQDDVVARIGGDEFAILSPNKSALQMQAYKDKLVLLSRDIIIDNIPVSLAIGYEMLNGSDNDINEPLSRAEKQLYRHKITVGESIRNHAIKAILNTLTDKYKEEKIHSEHVSFLCKQIGTELGLGKEEVDVLELAGMYHDIGKISIPDAILNKPGKLTDEEYDIIKTHTQIGYQILRAADEYSGLAEYALSHHERWDGRGYPKGLKGDAIPLFSRIINVADSFEAMTANRPYRKGMPIEDAILEIKRCSGSQFDPDIANLFLEKVLKHKQ